MISFAQDTVPAGSSFIHPQTGLPRITKHALERMNERSCREHPFADGFHLWRSLSDTARMSVIIGSSSVSIPKMGVRLCNRNGIVATVVPYESAAKSYYTAEHRDFGLRSMIA